jgi:hypothetical protein
MSEQMTKVPWPAKLVVLVTEPDGTTAYGLFDTDEDADDYIDRIAEECHPSATFDTALLWAK